MKEGGVAISLLNNSLLYTQILTFVSFSFPPSFLPPLPPYRPERSCCLIVREPRELSGDNKRIILRGDQIVSQDRDGVVPPGLRGRNNDLLERIEPAYGGNIEGEWGG